MPAGLDAVDVLVVTALQLERRAVRGHLDGVQVEDTSGLHADRGSFNVGNGKLEVAVIETGAGNIDAAVLASRAEEQFRPDVIAMTGVAGGLKDVSIGDVVASSKVYWLEGGKQRKQLQPRPEFAPVSTSLVLGARAVAADDHWLSGFLPPGGEWPDAGRPPRALVAPIVAGEKVLADEQSAVAGVARSVYGDAVVVDMEDFGTLRGGRSTERARVIAIRGVSDLVEGKSAADAAGSQPLAAANAAAFLFELLAVEYATEVRSADPRTLAALGAELYPEGPQQHGLWARAGGDESRLQPSGPGFARWWHAAVLVDQGGGGSALTMGSLLTTMAGDYPHNDRLTSLLRSLR